MDATTISRGSCDEIDASNATWVRASEAALASGDYDEMLAALRRLPAECDGDPLRARIRQWRERWTLCCRWLLLLRRRRRKPQQTHPILLLPSTTESAPGGSGRPRPVPRFPTEPTDRTKRKVFTAPVARVGTSARTTPPTIHSFYGGGVGPRKKTRTMESFFLLQR